MKTILKIAYYLVMCYFSYLMILITIQYIPIRFDVAFLNVKEEAIQHKYYQIAFFSHVFTSIFVLLSGIPQFSETIRNRYPKIHQVLGKIYVFLILFVASPSGLIMGFHGNGGTLSIIAFIFQAVLWFVFTLMAFEYAKQRKWQKHKDFMLRSFALTLSAITLRLLKWIIVSTLAPPPMDTYRFVSWAGWAVNLILVEIYLQIRNN